ncbi:DNA methyltransferase [Mariniblastus sp.]|nr:DNA methyltransferase [bacterium]MDA7903582.1 DNA methyltransferase [Mariniblastus sp.]MDB4386372.1 DNA methyltransferase [bacterium]
MAATLAKFLGKIHQGDCVAGLKKVPSESVDLAFADPPFNIGFKYDQYDDQLGDDQYLAWSREWMAELHRVLKSEGAFWLAIGDEYAAELKIEAQNLGFHCRSWVIWYYTFGVNCKKKFTRSHAHIFHFVKDEKNFLFNHDDMDLRVPSARRLVYNDARANPNGRMPDDTWILRPQELVDGFQADEDTWYFPRVAGTFKERAGFHGCQMPEQLLGRVIRSSSNEGDVVIDPFSGSSTTLAVAKKLRRECFGFELSKDYVRLGMERLDRISPGDRLNGSEEPSMSEYAKRDAQKAKGVEKVQRALFADDADIHESLVCEIAQIIEAFSKTNRGYSVDRLIADPILNEDFQLACDRLLVPGTPAERNRFLFRIRKAGKLKAASVDTTVRTKIGWREVSPFLFASEIAWRQIVNKYCMSLDEIFCDPRIGVQFDAIASGFAPGYQPLDYRWAALKLRKEGSNAKHRATLRTPKQLGISELSKKKLKSIQGALVSELDLDVIPEGPGVYVIRELGGDALYAGETEQLASRIATTFGTAGPREMWLKQFNDLELFVHQVSTVTDHRFARQSVLLKWHRPAWNTVKELAG